MEAENIIQQIRRSGRIILPESMFEAEGDKIVLKRQVLLPKGWEPSDHDKTENLIEIEDTTKGGRFWIPVKKFFINDFKIGGKVELLKPNQHILTGDRTYAEVTEFVAHQRRKRTYLQVVCKSITA